MHSTTPSEATTFIPQYTPRPYQNRQMQPGPSRARRGESQFEYDYAPQIECGVLSQGVVDDRSNWGDGPDQNEQIARTVNAPSEQQQAEALKVSRTVRFGSYLRL